MDNQNQPKSWLVESILVTIFCCLPLGIVGIIKASKVKSLFEAGQIDLANAASAEAKKWVIYSVISGIIVGVLYFVFVFFFMKSMGSLYNLPQ